MAKTVQLSKGILDLASTAGASKGTEQTPRLSYADRLRGTQASTTNQPSFFPPSSVGVWKIKLQEGDIDGTLKQRSLKLHLTGRNATGLSQEAIFAALMGIGIAKREIYALWEVNLTFRSEASVDTCLMEDTLDLPNNVSRTFSPSSGSVVDIRIHWVPAQVSDQVFVRLFQGLGKIRGIHSFENERGVKTGVRSLRLEIAKHRQHEIPYLISMEEEGAQFLVTVRGRAHQCLGCGQIGHTRSFCPRTTRGQQQIQRHKVQQQVASKMTSLGEVARQRTNTPSQEGAAAGRPGTIIIQPGSVANQPETVVNKPEAVAQQPEDTGVVPEAVGSPERAVGSQPESVDDSLMVVINHPEVGTSHPKVQTSKEEAAGSTHEDPESVWDPLSSQDTTIPDSQLLVTQTSQDDLDLDPSPSLSPTTQETMPEDSLPCGQAVLRDDRELSEARHPGLSQMLVPQPRRPTSRSEDGKRKSEPSPDLSKRRCVLDDEMDLEEH